MIEPVTFPIAVDVVALTVIDHTLHALVVRRGIEPFRDRLALPGGFLRSGEQTDQAAARELEEETGVTPPVTLSSCALTAPLGVTRAARFFPWPTCSWPLLSPLLMRGRRRRGAVAAR